MNDLTQFLIQIIGPVAFVVGLGLALNSKYYEKAYKNLDKSPVILLLTGMAATIIGFTIVLKHNLWGSFEEGIVTLIGWMSLIKGILLSIAPGFMAKLAKMMVTPAYLVFAGLLVAILGGYLIYLGYGDCLLWKKITSCTS